MPLFFKPTCDLFEFANVADIVVNLVNLIGVSGAGLAAEFRERAPNFIPVYQDWCRTKELRVGTVKLFKETNLPYDILAFPTKRHYQDESKPEDIKRSLIALRALLQEKEYQYSSIIMPMAGTGLGKQSYDTVLPMMLEYLADLDATVILCLHPDKTTIDPKYLMVTGPLDYARNDQEKEAVVTAIEKSLELKFGTKLSDYEGVITGGMDGVDHFLGGHHYLKDVEDTWVYKATGKPALVIKPNKVRNGIGASLHQGNLMAEIAHDAVLIKPKGHNNNRMSAIQTWLKTQESIGLQKRRMTIFGETDVTMVTNDAIVPADIPY